MNRSSSKWSDHFLIAAVSDIGMRRNNNQDSYILLPASDHTTWESRGHIFVVADGMGAHAAGELASKLAVEGVVHHYCKQRQLSPPEAIMRALRDTNSEIHQRGQANSEFHNMGTTCSALLLLPQGAVVAHVGDSRVYRVRSRRIEQLTFDHSLLWEMQAAGSLSGSDTKLNIPRNVITRSLGPQANVQVDLEGPLDIQQGDTFLLCSDGLTGKIEDAEIGEVLTLLPPEDAAQFLVDLANLRGGPDNITAIIIQVISADVQTRNWRGEPLRVGQDLRPPHRVHPAYWIAIFLGLVLAAGFSVLHLYVYALAAAAAAILAGLLAALTSIDRGDGVPLASGRRLGRAPYVRIDVETSSKQISRFAESIQAAIRQNNGAANDELGRAAACLNEGMTKTQRGEYQASMQMLAVAARLTAQNVAASETSY